ncbi:unnamed protein product [Discosporangium mesarthrocarpum]
MHGDGCGSMRGQGFGLKILPSVSSHCISSPFGGIVGSYAAFWVDGIPIHSTSFEEHLKHVDDVFKRLSTARFSIDFAKSKCVCASLDYLGMKISGQGVEPSPTTVEAD